MPKNILFRFVDVHLHLSDLPILSNLNFQIERGEFVAVIGASGAGKSSLLKMFNALNSPSQGQVTYRGADLEADIPALRKSVGIVFQNPVVFAGTVKDNLLIAGRWDQRIKQVLDHDLVMALEQVGLQGVKLSHHAKDLSGGEQQRLAFARTLLNHPQVLLLDEPTSNLDPKLSREIMELVDELKRTLDLTVIIVSHNHLLMARHAKRVIILSEGEIIGDGDFETLKKSHVFEDAGLLSQEANDAS